MERRAGMIVTALVMLAGCATAKKEARLPVFYPPLPNPPRIQHLASFSSAADVVSSCIHAASSIATDVDICSSASPAPAKRPLHVCGPTTPPES